MPPPVKLATVNAPAGHAAAPATIVQVTAFVDGQLKPTPITSVKTAPFRAAGPLLITFNT